MRWRAAAVCAAVLLATPAAAQTTRPGPWVLDIRGVTSPVPDAPAFYPALDSTARVPTRGFGLDLGAHVYLLNLGAARLGVGADVFNVRATTKPPAPAASPGTMTPGPDPAGQGVQVEMRIVSPQLSFNFGTRDGWSYLSAGMGPADVIARTSDRNPGRRESGRLNALNAGGGARWFLRSRLAFGFDLRLHRLPAGTSGTLEQSPGDEAAPDPAPGAPVAPAPTPGRMLMTVAVGFSVR